jgi:HK97 gp10 family phage protein
MADHINFKIDGLDKLIEKLGKLPVEIEKEVANEVNASALAIQSKAKRDCRVDFSTLRSSIQLESIFKDKRIIYTVGSHMKYAPYVEFGTGGLVNIPAGYEDFAMQFKGKGIRKVNLRARPFLIPAFESEIPNLRKNIQNVIKDVKS